MAQDTVAAAAAPSEEAESTATVPAASVEAPAADATGPGAGVAPTEEQFFEAEGFTDDDAEATAAALEELGLEGDDAAAAALLGPAQRDAGKAQAAKEEGNRLYQEGDNEGALRSYTRAIRLCPFQYDRERELARARRRALRMEEEATGARDPAAAAAPGEGAAAEQGAGARARAGAEAGGQQQPEEEAEEAEEAEPFAEHKGDAAVYYCNRAACLVNLARDQEAVDDCTVAIKLRPDYLKALMRRAQASERLDKLEDALRDYKKVVELEPGNRAARAKIPGLERACQERMEKLKAETLGKLKELGNSVLSNFGLSLDNFKMQQDPNTGSYSISFQK